MASNYIILFTCFSLICRIMNKKNRNKAIYFDSTLFIYDKSYDFITEKNWHSFEDKWLISSNENKEK